ncbi:MAG: integrin alpha, partial [Planctomycetaceae bacterium]
MFSHLDGSRDRSFSSLLKALKTGCRKRLNRQRRTALQAEELESRWLLSAPNPWQLDSLTGSDGFRMNGIAMVDFAGISVDGAGDVNGDGFDDAVVGAFNGNSGTGQAYLVFGQPSGFDPTMGLGALTGLDGFAINGVSFGDKLGWSVSGGGDFDGDGLDDFIIGAPEANSNGSSYILYGANDGYGGSVDLVNLGNVGNPDGFRMDGVAGGDEAGLSVSVGGDFNTDGFADLLIGARSADPGAIPDAGQSYAVFGSDAVFAGPVDLGTVGDPGSDAGLRLNGVDPVGNSGTSISHAGDINGDGFGDLIIGGPLVDIGGTADRGA